MSDFVADDGVEMMLDQVVEEVARVSAVQRYRREIDAKLDAMEGAGPDVRKLALDLEVLLNAWANERETILLKRAVEVGRFLGSIAIVQAIQVPAVVAKVLTIPTVLTPSPRASKRRAGARRRAKRARSGSRGRRAARERAR